MLLGLLNFHEKKMSQAIIVVIILMVKAPQFPSKDIEEGFFSQVLHSKPTRKNNYWTMESEELGR